MKKTCPFYRKRKKDGDNMDSKLLKWYVKLYEKRSLRQAAADLYISPQGLSHGLQSLENELDVILFERTAQGLTPTEAGSYFYQYARESLESYRQMEASLRALGGRTKEVSFVCSYGAMNALPYERFLEFQKLHPDYQIKWREYPDKYAARMLKEEDYELGLLVMDEEGFGEDYEASLLFYKQMMVLVYEGHPLYGKETIDYSDLKDEKIVMEGNDFWIYDAFRRRCIARGFCPKIITETGDISFSHKLCSMKQGLGITVDFIADFINTPGVRAIPLDDPSFLWKVFLVYHKKKILSPAARELCRFLKERGETGSC